MRLFRLITVVALLVLLLFSCAEVEPVKEPEAVMKGAPVSSYIYRSGGDLIIDMAIPEQGWEYTSLLSDDGITYTLVVKNIKRELGNVEYVRPVIDFEKTKYPSGFKLVFTLASKHQLKTSRTELGLQIVLTALEPDMEMLSMKTFGGWASPMIPAATFQGALSENAVTEIEFDNEPVYATGEAGGRYYLDIFGVNILPGIVKHEGLLATNRLEGKPDLYLKIKWMSVPMISG